MANEVKTELVTFKYPGPQSPGRDRGPQRGVSYPMVTNDICVSTVQVFHEKGGGTTLHYHNNEDGYWLVLGGRAQFFNSEHEVIADLGKFEGIFVPRFTRYYFESSDEKEPLEILRVSHHSETKHDHVEPAGEAKED
jgi:mannose-6-phosphate isomerase-like protein (cupin superfamily)